MAPAFGWPLLPYSDIPAQINFVITYLDRNIHTVEGCFRVPGNEREVELLIATLDTEGSLSTINLADFSTFSVCDVLKRFFTMLPDPVLPFDVYHKLLNLPDILIDRVASIREIIRILPPANRRLLRRLLSFLSRISRNSHINRMDSYNLATIFAPCLARARDPSGMALQPRTGGSLFASKYLQSSPSTLSFSSTRDVEINTFLQTPILVETFHTMISQAIDIFSDSQDTLHFDPSSNGVQNLDDLVTVEEELRYRVDELAITSLILKNRLTSLEDEVRSLETRETNGKLEVSLVQMRATAEELTEERLRLKKAKICAVLNLQKVLVQKAEFGERATDSPSLRSKRAVSILAPLELTCRKKSDGSSSKISPGSKSSQVYMDLFIIQHCVVVTTNVLCSRTSKWVEYVMRITTASTPSWFCSHRYSEIRDVFTSVLENGVIEDGFSFPCKTFFNDGTSPDIVKERICAFNKFFASVVVPRVLTSLPRKTIGMLEQFLYVQRGCPRILRYFCRLWIRRHRAVKKIQHFLKSRLPRYRFLMLRRAIVVLQVRFRYFRKRQKLKPSVAITIVKRFLLHIIMNKRLMARVHSVGTAGTCSGVIREIVTLERRYVITLKSLRYDYEKSLVTLYDHASLTTIEKMISLHSTLLEDLESAIAQFGTLNGGVFSDDVNEAPSMDVIVPRVSSAFARISPLLKCYKVYVSTMNPFILNQKVDTNPELIKLCNNCSNDDKGIRNLRNLLTLPLQQIPKYELLLAKLNKLLQSEKSKPLPQSSIHSRTSSLRALEYAQEEIHMIAAAVEVVAREKEKQFMLNRVTKILPDLNISDQNRFLIRSGWLGFGITTQQHMKPVAPEVALCILFNDMFVVTKARASRNMAVPSWSDLYFDRYMVDVLCDFNNEMSFGEPSVDYVRAFALSEILLECVLMHDSYMIRIVHRRCRDDSLMIVAPSHDVLESWMRDLDLYSKSDCCSTNVNHIVQVAIPSSATVDIEKDRFVVYHIEVSTYLKSWFVCHRFREFKDLSSMLSSTFPLVKLPPFPSSSYIFSSKLSSSVTESRMKELAVWLQSVVAKLPLSIWHVLNEFLEEGSGISVPLDRLSNVSKISLTPILIVTCIENYIAENSEEMSIFIGDQITVYETYGGDTWWWGVCEGNEGFFPSNFVSK